MYFYHNDYETLGIFFRSYSEILCKFGAISFQEFASKGITHLVFYGDLIYKPRRIKDAAISSLQVRKLLKVIDVGSMTK